jgi:hypothetical protein
MSNSLVDLQDENQKRDKLEEFLSKKVRLAENCHIFLEMTNYNYD